jgi:hypothetical protein
MGILTISFLKLDELFLDFFELLILLQALLSELLNSVVNLLH